MRQSGDTIISLELDDEELVRIIIALDLQIELSARTRMSEQHKEQAEELATLRQKLFDLLPEDSQSFFKELMAKEFQS
jgi:hypothetical protein